jgi:hypothetical protein
VQILIEASDLPGSSCGPSPDRPSGYHGIHVAVQRRSPRDQLLGLVPGDAATASWALDCTAVPSASGTDVKGPCIQGPPGGRFIYLAWGTMAGDGVFAMFRRAKLRLDAVPADVLGSAAESGVLVGRLGLTDQKGHPLCASVRPPLIQWSAAPPAGV